MKEIFHNRGGGVDTYIAERQADGKSEKIISLCGTEFSSLSPRVYIHKYCVWPADSGAEKVLYRNRYRVKSDSEREEKESEKILQESRNETWQAFSRRT